MDDVGVRLKKLRELHGLSQRELARQSGVSNAMICLIEKGKSRPSLGLLKNILEAFPVSIAEFFSMELKQATRAFYRREELTEIGSGLISYRQIGSNLDEVKLQVLLECYQPGADTGRSMLHHEAEEGGVIISGQLEVTVGDQIQVLGPGDAYLFNSRIPHRFRNTGKEACVLVSSCTPPSF
ncbi:MAG: cupin domain-containing protein [Gammaproteobacteria bacterium]